MLETDSVLIQRAAPSASANLTRSRSDWASDAIVATPGGLVVAECSVDDCIADGLSLPVPGSRVQHGIEIVHQPRHEIRRQLPRRAIALTSSPDRLRKMRIVDEARDHVPVQMGRDI